jgi:hypothetical protein
LRERRNAVAQHRNAILTGTYLFAYDGFEIKDGDKVPFAVAGREVRDGLGKVTGVCSYSVNGKITRRETFEGEYHVRQDGTGTNTFTDGSKYDMFIAPDGSKFTVVQTNRGFVASWTTKRV